VPGLAYYRHLLEVKSAPQIDRIIKELKSVIKPEEKGSKWLCDLNESAIDEIKPEAQLLGVISSWNKSINLFIRRTYKMKRIMHFFNQIACSCKSK